MLVAIAITGCGEKSHTTVKYFSGEPVDHWLEEIKSNDPKTRKKAADVLGNIGPVDSRSIGALIVAVKDKDVKVRTAAVLALSKIGKPAVEALPALQEATQDKDKIVRSSASNAIERINGRL